MTALDWELYAITNIVFVWKLANVILLRTFLNLQCQRQHLLQPQVRTRIKFHPPTKDITYLCIPRDVFTSRSSDGGGGDGGKGRWSLTKTSCVGDTTCKPRGFAAKVIKRVDLPTPHLLDPFRSLYMTFPFPLLQLSKQYVFFPEIVVFLKIISKLDNYFDHFSFYVFVIVMLCYIRYRRVPLFTLWRQCHLSEYHWFLHLHV